MCISEPFCILDRALAMQEPHYVHAEHMYEAWAVSSIRFALMMLFVCCCRLRCPHG